MANLRDARAALADALPSFTCPLTLDVMNDPVMLNTGQTYERAAIEGWLSNHDTCPSSGVVLAGDHALVPNFALKNSIEEWKDRTGVALRALSHTVPFDCIRIETLLVSARTKDVYKGMMLRKPVAVCVLKGPGDAIGDREADILSTIGRHPHIVQFLARSTDTQGRPVVVLELATLGQNLHQLLTTLADDETVVSEQVVHSILYQVADGMAALHENGIVHKDLAARNILMFSFDPSSADHILVKVSDFGMSSLLDAAAASSYYYGGDGSRRELPVRWMAPESLDRNNWSEKSDVFSFGVLIWEILSMGRVPWGLGASNEAIQAKVTGGEVLACQSHWPRSLVDLVNQCCSLNPRERPSFLELKARLFRPQAPSKAAAGGAQAEDSQRPPPPPEDAKQRNDKAQAPAPSDLRSTLAVLGFDEEQVSNMFLKLMLCIA